MTLHDSTVDASAAMAATPRPSAWSAVAHCVGLDTCTVVGGHLAALVGAVRTVGTVGTVGAVGSTRRDHNAAPADAWSNGTASPNELLVQRLQALDVSDAPIDDVVALIASVHSETGRDRSAPHGAATITVVVRDGPTIAVVHVGDASAFRIRHGAVAELTPLTHCHTLAADLRAVGKQPNARADSVVTRVVGGDLDDLTIDVTRVTIEPGRTSFVVVAHPPADLTELIQAAGSTRSANATLDAIRSILASDTAAIVVEARSDVAIESVADRDPEFVT